MLITLAASFAEKQEHKCWRHASDQHARQAGAVPQSPACKPAAKQLLTLGTARQLPHPLRSPTALVLPYAAPFHPEHVHDVH